MCGGRGDYGAPLRGSAPVVDSLPLVSELGVCPSFVSQEELYLMIVAALVWTFSYLLNFHITLNYGSRDFSVLRCIRR